MCTVPSWQRKLEERGLDKTIASVTASSNGKKPPTGAGLGALPGAGSSSSLSAIADLSPRTRALPVNRSVASDLLEEWRREERTAGPKSSCMSYTTAILVYGAYTLIGDGSTHLDCELWVYQHLSCLLSVCAAGLAKRLENDLRSLRQNFDGLTAAARVGRPPQGSTPRSGSSSPRKWMSAVPPVLSSNDGNRYHWKKDHI